MPLSDAQREAMLVERVRADALQEGDRVWDDNGEFREITGFGKWVEGSGREHWINAQLGPPYLKMWLDAPDDEMVLRAARSSASLIDSSSFNCCHCGHHYAVHTAEGLKPCTWDGCDCRELYLAGNRGRAATHSDPNEDAILAAWQSVPEQLRRSGEWMAFRAGYRVRMVNLETTLKEIMGLAANVLRDPLSSGLSRAGTREISDKADRALGVASSQHETLDDEVERVAKAIYEANFTHPILPWDRLIHATQDDCRRLAHAAIYALRKL